MAGIHSIHHLVGAFFRLDHINGDFRRQRIAFVIDSFVRCQLGPDGRDLTEVGQDVGVAFRVLLVFSAVPAGDLVMGALFLKVAFTAH